MSALLSKISNPNGIDLSWKNEFKGLLDKNLGKDIQEFEWQGKKYTPKSYASYLGLNMDNYVSITSFTNHPIYSKCQLEIPDNWAWGESYNVPLDDLFNITEQALKNGYTVAWGDDVSEKGFSFKNGIAIVPENSGQIEVKGKDNKGFNDAGADRSGNQFTSPGKELVITAENRQLAYDNKTTTDDHGMHIVGLFKDQNGTKYFLVKNSWGSGNYPKGFLYVSENYFRFKTINVYLHKDAISTDLKSKLNLN
jgi:bleomycin hydrolase